MSRYHNPAAIAQGQQPATDRQTTEQLVECCVADAGLQSNLWQTVGHASSCWYQSRYKLQDLEQLSTEWWCQARSWMDILRVNAAGEQWHTRTAPTCWYSAEVGWTASSCEPGQCMPTDAAVGPVWLTDCNDHIPVCHQHTDEDRNHNFGSVQLGQQCTI